MSSPGPRAALVVLGALLLLPAAARPAPRDADCLACHSQEGLEAVTPRGQKLKLHVPEDALAGSVHEMLSCTDCHVGATSFDDVPHSARPMTYGCAACHEAEERSYRERDAHGKGLRNASPRAPYCNGCHGGHHILPISSPESAMAPTREPETCGRCHASELLNEEDNISKRNLITRYRESVHWQALQAGKPAATCSSCHTAHSILDSDSPQSSTSRSGVVETCGHCHGEEAAAYRTGSHGRTLLSGNHDVPTCTTCHGDHDMTSLRGRQGDARTWAATQVCIWCHGNERMMRRYALDTVPVESYLKDFHGLTQRGTMGSSATCADCHEAHHSLPSSHPASRMHLTNRGAACGQCHGKVSQNFITSFSHRNAAQATEFWILGLVRNLYLLLIVGTIGAMLAHNSVIWWWAVRRKLRAEERSARLVRRMTRFEVVLHLALFLSFSALVLTGFMLKVPDHFWVRWLFALGVTEAVRAAVHRLAAVVMVADFVVLFLYLALRPRGRVILREILPSPRDLRELASTLRYYAGRGGEAPRYGLFNYAEKAEFWALVWGTVIMVVTGLVLWFPKLIPATWPGWVLELSRTIHFYEAVLAALAILVWHFFLTIFHPDEYPMNASWLTGVLSEEEARHRFTDEAVRRMAPPPRPAEATPPAGDGPAASAVPPPGEGPPPDGTPPAAGS